MPAWERGCAAARAKTFSLFEAIQSPEHSHVIALRSVFVSVPVCVSFVCHACVKTEGARESLALTSGTVLQPSRTLPLTVMALLGSACLRRWWVVFPLYTTLSTYSRGCSAPLGRTRNRPSSMPWSRNSAVWRGICYLLRWSKTKREGGEQNDRLAMGNVNR